MMDCEGIKRSLGAWLDGELSHSEAEPIRAHLQGCPLCLEEKTRLETIQASLKGVLVEKASGVAFEPFWNGVRQRILERRPWHVQLWHWVRPAFYPQKLAWLIPVGIIILLGVFSMEPFFPGWYWGSSRGNLTAVESIDGHGFNVALFRESKTKTTVIWLFENHEDEEEASEESAPSKPSF